MGRKIGIDLGTTYSCVSYVDEHGVVRIVDNREGEQITPSVVFFDEDGTVVVGSTARAEGAQRPDAIVERVKNYMGNPDYCVNINGEDYSPTAVSTLILRKLISDTEEMFGDEEIEGAVITVPAYFGDEARNATKMAGENVELKNGQKLNVLKILDEPTAAAISFGQSKNVDMNKNVLIYDLGGGTFDCTVMHLEFENGNRKMEVITTDGNHQLGGKDWDAALKDYVIQKFCEATNEDVEEMTNDAEMICWFSENVEKAKKNLTNREVTSLTPSFNGRKEKIEITREAFNDCTSSLLDQTIAKIDEMMNKKGLTIENDIDEIILVGGSTRMLQVREKLESTYNKPINSFEPDKAVAMGAAYVAKDYVPVTEENIIDFFNEVDTSIGEQPATTGFTLTGAFGETTQVIENCTKSYGVRVRIGNEDKVLNLVLKDTPKPAIGKSIDHFPLTINGEHVLVDEVAILVVENNEMEEQVDLDICDMIYVEEPIQFEGSVYGDSEVSVEMIVDANGNLSLILNDISNGKIYEMKPKRISDEANEIGVDAVKKFTLR